MIEGCAGRSTLELRGENLLIGLPARATKPVRLARGRCLTCLPVGRSAYALLVHDVDDDFKTTADDGGTWLGRSLESWLTKAHGAGAAIEARTLWDFPLWRSGPIDRMLVEHAWMMRYPASPPTAWWGRARSSAAEILDRVNHGRLLRERAAIRSRVSLATAGDRLLDHPWLEASRIVGDLERASDGARLAARLLSDADVHDDALAAARLTMAAHEITRRFPRSVPRSAGDLRARALAHVGRAVEAQIDLPAHPGAAAIAPDQAVCVRMPVRLDLAGGWSDTPPICNELGGTVLNAAVSLEERLPIQVVAKLTNAPTITLTSVDLGQSATITRTAELLECGDPRDWTNLVKAAIVLSGLAPRTARGQLTRALERLGGGLAITTSSGVPKGSGLGTSSILGAAVLACLDRVVGRPVDPAALCERTSALEQMLGSRGGWQDQIGGVFGGIKISRTPAGLSQRPRVESITVPADCREALRARSILYYTGYRRLARDILETVVGRYLARDPEPVQAVHRLKAGAESMREALRAGDIDAFARDLSEYWVLKRTLDPASTNERIEAIVAPHVRDLAAWELPGAGGGGFLLMIARDDRSAQRMRRRLQRHPVNDRARTFAFDIVSEGMTVSAT